MATENTIQSRMDEIAPAEKAKGGLKLYLFLLGVQTIGATIILANGGPVYRQMARDFANHQAQRGILWWAVAGVALIQAAYWSRLRLQPALPQTSHVLIAHVAGFIARLSFILASSAFVVIFLVRFDQLSLPPHRVAMIIVVLFSMFCWTLELERLAKALQERN